MKITKLSSNECGGYQKPKGHLDTQLFPECKGTPCDRDIVKKTVEKRKKSKGKKKEASGNILEKKALSGGDVVRHKIYNYSPEVILRAIKKIGEESIAGFSGVTLDDLDTVISVAEDYELAEILRAAEVIDQELKRQPELAFASKSKGKKKKWDPNPWAVCHTTVDKDKDPEKFERCVQDVKKKQAFNLSKYIKIAK